MGVKITKDRVAEVMRGVKALVKAEVLIGIPETRADRKPEEGEEKTPISNAAIGYISEYGSPKRNIPARPFLIPGVESIKDRAIPRLKRAGQSAIDGDSRDIAKSLIAIGIMGQSAVQKKIVDGPFTPLKPATIAAREHEGFKGTKPLIRTGQLRQAITFVLRDKGK